MADHHRLSTAQKQALTRVRQEGRLYSHNGVTRPTIRTLESQGLVRVTWSRRHRSARQTKSGSWHVRSEVEWVAEPVIEDYQVYLRAANGQETRMTVYAALGPDDAMEKAKERFFDLYCGGVPVEVEAVKADPMTSALFFLF